MEDETPVIIPEPVESLPPEPPIISEPLESAPPGRAPSPPPPGPVRPPPAEPVVFDGTPNCAGCGKPFLSSPHSRAAPNPRRQDDGHDVLHPRGEAVLRDLHGRAAYAYLSALQEEDHGGVPRVLQLEVPSAVLSVQGVQCAYQ